MLGLHRNENLGTVSRRAHAHISVGSVEWTFWPLGYAHPALVDAPSFPKCVPKVYEGLGCPTFSPALWVELDKNSFDERMIVDDNSSSLKLL